MIAPTLMLVGFLAAPDAAAPAGPPDAAKVVAAIQSFYQSTRDLRATFTQTYTYKVYDRTQVSSGQVFFKKPGKMRWDYTQPVSKLFIADGATLWVYEPDENQVFKRPLSQSQLPVALTFMSGKGRLEDEFDAKLLPPPDPGSLLVELIPRKSEGDYKSLHLLVDRKTFAVKASTVVDPVGNTNHLVFSGVKINTGLPDEGFAFKVPKGVRVITEPGARPNAP